jgi:hypothetical protein
LGKWFETKSFDNAEEIFFKELEKDEIDLEKYLNFKDGFIYYKL